MYNDSRIEIYNYLYGLFYGTVTENVYSMNEPQELTESDTKDGFIVLHVGNIVDESEFDLSAFGSVRCFVEAFVPLISRGRLDVEKYQMFEQRITDVIKDAVANPSGDYYIQDDVILSMDDIETSNANNPYFTFVKSFIVNIEKDNS